MDTSFDRLDDHTVKLTVTVTAEEVDAAIDAAYRRMAKNVRIPGFRPGKAPKPMIDTHVGREAVLADAQDELLNEQYGEALDRHGLRPIGSPEVGELDLMKAGEPFEFTAEVEVRPELTLSSIEDLSATVPPAKTTDREIDAQIEHTRERFAQLEPVEDRGVAADDFVLISFIGKIDGEEYEGNVVDKYLYEMGRGLMPAEFDEGLIGTMPGGEAVASFVISEHSSNPEHVGKPATFDVSVHEIKAKVLPEIDDEFASNVGGYDSVEEMRESLREQMDSTKAVGHVRLVERAAREALAGRLEGDAPEAMIENAKNGMMRDFINNLESRQMTLKDYLEVTGSNLEQVENDIGEQARASVREELALEALFRQMGWEITDEDVDAELAALAGAGESDPAELRKKWTEAGVMPVLHEQIMHKRAVRWLMDAENVKIIEEETPAEGDTGDDKE